MRDPYYRANQGFLLGYSITDRLSFESMHSWREHIIRVKSSMHDNYDPRDLPIVLVGNKVGSPRGVLSYPIRFLPFCEKKKCDLDDQRVISLIQGQELAKQWGVPFFETSAKTGTWSLAFPKY